MAALPPLSPPHLELVSERRDANGFLCLHRTELRVQGSPPAAYDYVSRPALDSSVIAAHFERDGERFVYLRSAVRPPLALRGLVSSLWELPAGLIEPGESPAEAAQRELEEELGFRVDLTQVARLGGPVFPAPAVEAEEQHFFSVRVDPDTQRPPAGDGSPFEALSVIATVSFTEVRSLIARGELRDGKTELGLRRLLETT